MTDFYHHRTIGRTCTVHVCEQCQTNIDVGSPAEYWSGTYYGDFYSTYAHVECHAAAKEYADRHDLVGEDWPWLHAWWTDEPEIDHQWLRDEHPIVARRLRLFDEVPA